MTSSTRIRSPSRFVTLTPGGEWFIILGEGFTYAKLIAFQHLSLVAKFRCLSFEDNFPPVDDADPIAESLDVIQKMRRKKNADTFFAIEIEEQVVNIVTSFRVKATGRYVEDQKILIIYKCSRKSQALLHAAGIPADDGPAVAIETDA